MNKHKVDSTLILKRVYDVPLASVWNAWTNQKEIAKWWVGEGDHVVHFARRMSALAGPIASVLRPPGKTPWVETGRYSEVALLQLLVYQEMVTQHDQIIHTNEIRIDFHDLGAKTEVTVTTSGFESWRNAEGWVPSLEKLAAALAS
jgi:uncharacterized protein YndB with AHSA1/START domain